MQFTYHTDKQLCNLNNSKGGREHPKMSNLGQPIHNDQNYNMVLDRMEPCNKIERDVDDVLLD